MSKKDEQTLDTTLDTISLKHKNKISQLDGIALFEDDDNNIQTISTDEQDEYDEDDPYDGYLFY